MLTSYSSLGGSLQPTLDHRAYPFEDSLEVPLTIKEKRYENYIPVSNTTGITSATTGRIEFNIPAVSDQSMLNLKDSFVELVLQIPALAAAVNAGPTMFGVDAMINDVQIYFGSTLVSEPHGGNTAPFQSVIKRCLTRPTCGYITGTAGVQDIKLDTLEELEFVQQTTGGDLIQTADGAAGMPVFLAGSKAYSSAPAAAKSLTLRYRIQDGVFQTSKFFPSNMNVRIVLSIQLMNGFQENPGANAISNGGVSLTSAEFYLSRVFLTDESLKAQNQAILRSPFKYILPYSKVETKLVPAGQSFFNVTGLFQSQTKPDLVILAFQSNTKDKTWPFFACGSSATAGIGLAPTVNNLYIRWNGKQYPQATAPALASNMRTYQQYVENCLDDNFPMLTYSQWLNYFTFYVINLRDDGEKIYGLAPSMEQGAIELSCTFSAPTANAYTMYAIALTHCKLEISEAGSINKINYIN